MINQSSNQTSGTRPKVLSVSKTVTPTGYDKSTEGFNSWVTHVKSQVHISFTPTVKMIMYQNLFKNEFKR
ncbi:hypothetical protein AY601_4117 [Pedobacter cryoconitis]|uniref:Uncharacterized protein n=1 Tax=Pedobacter cryoconitis TaxID=188932 RepID=A0A127VI73_9SPHI|nr:hypothetical protein AY601_4117 [Pedobacter cryoconitis]